MSLSWGASSDNVGVTGYNVYSGANQVLSVSGTSATVSGLSPSTAYTFTVRARDAAGNVSAASNSLAVTTNAGTPGTTLQAGGAVPLPRLGRSAGRELR